MSWFYLKIIIFWTAVFSILFYWRKENWIFSLKFLLASFFITTQFLGYIKILPFKANFWLEVFGITLFIIGTSFQITGKIALGENWNTLGSKPKKIVGSSSYKIVRHPIYLGMFLFLIGIELIVESWFFLIFGIFTLLEYLL